MSSMSTRVLARVQHSLAALLLHRVIMAANHVKVLLESALGERKKPINIKNFGGTPPGVCPVCPGDTSHLSHDMSRLSRGHSVLLALIYT